MRDLHAAYGCELPSRIRNRDAWIRWPEERSWERSRLSEEMAAYSPSYRSTSRIPRRCYEINHFLATS